jgi:MFS family permease
VTVITRERQTQAQRALVIVFLIQGFVSAAIIPRVPDIIRNIDVSFAHWGVISAFGTVGSAAGLFLANRALERFGVKHVGMASFGVVGLGTGSFGFITDSTLYFGVNFIVAVSMSIFVIAVNSQTVVLQTLSGRVIIGRFHAAWSAGAASSAAISGFLAGLIPAGIHLFVFTAVGLFAFYIVARKLLNREEGLIAEGNTGESAVAWRHMPKRVYLLGVGLAVGVFPEAALWDWSSVYGRDALGYDPARAAIPYAFFAIAMIVGRLLIDVIGKRVHISMQAAVGGTIAAIAMMVSVLVGPGLVAADPSGALFVISALWALAGLGTASMTPSFLSSASIVSGMSAAAALTRMSVMQTTLIFAMKWLMGQTAESSGVGNAFLFPIGTWVVAVVIAVIVVRLSRRHHANQVSSN